MEIKEGMYVRTKDGEIAKIDGCLGKDSGYKNMEHYETDRMVTKFNNFILYKEHIVKASHNIIDLIEKGDYVNGQYVYGTGYNIYDDYGVKIEEDLKHSSVIRENEIKTILTHEQFESISYKMSYKVGEV